MFPADCAPCTQTVAEGGHSVTNGDCKREPRRIARVLARCRVKHKNTFTTESDDTFILYY